MASSSTPAGSARAPRAARSLARLEATRVTAPRSTHPAGRAPARRALGQTSLVARSRCAARRPTASSAAPSSSRFPTGRGLPPTSRQRADHEVKVDEGIEGPDQERASACRAALQCRPRALARAWPDQARARATLRHLAEGSRRTSSTRRSRSCAARAASRRAASTRSTSAGIGPPVSQRHDPEEVTSCLGSTISRANFRSSRPRMPEFHVWGAGAPAWSGPTASPSPRSCARDLWTVVAAAFEMRTRLRGALGLQIFVRTTAATLSTSLPRSSCRRRWAAVKDFSPRLTLPSRADIPQGFALTSSKAERRVRLRRLPAQQPRCHRRHRDGRRAPGRAPPSPRRSARTSSGRMRADRSASRRPPGAGSPI